jgi:methylisocitrate lyase
LTTSRLSAQTRDGAESQSGLLQPKTDQNFLLIARTDARASEGLDKTIDRIKAYVDAGAEMIFPEAMQGPGEFEAIRKAVDVPMLANMTEFGKSPLVRCEDSREYLGLQFGNLPSHELALGL